MTQVTMSMVVVLCLSTAPDAMAGLIATSVDETPFAVDVEIAWTEEGTEQRYVVPGLEDWMVRVAITDRTDEWEVEVDVSHLLEPHPDAAARGYVDSFGGVVVGLFGDGDFGPVLSLNGVARHSAVVPTGVGNAGPPHFDLIDVAVLRVEPSAISQVNRIEIRARHIAPVPEPGTFLLLSGGVLCVLPRYRRRRRTCTSECIT